MNDKKLTIYWNDGIVGHLWLDRKKYFCFQYDPAWLERIERTPLSISLPLQLAPYENDVPRPFFSNLLPEQNIRKVIARKLGISAKNDFSLLEAIGGECAGAISVWSEGHFPTQAESYRALPVHDLEKIIAEMPVTPILISEEGLRLSLAGAQNKLPVYKKKEKLFLPVGGASSSHILKPQSREFPHTVENEAFCMLLSSRVGLPTPQVSIFHAGIAVAYLVERYDRVISENGKLIRIHQEDFCQAMRFSPDEKYEGEGGPSLATCFLFLVDHSSRPLADSMLLLRWVVFNLLIGNCDAHAKNISLLLTRDEIRLAPFYDLLCTTVYPSLTKNMAMTIGGAKQAADVTLTHLEAFAASISIKPKLIVDICLDMARTLPKECSSVSTLAIFSDESRKTILGINAEILKNCAQILTRLQS